MWAASFPGVNQQALGVAASRLRVDGWAADAVVALRAGGVEPILLKGPVIARWLYADNLAARPYVDVDLLVSPADWDRAGAVLRGLGYEKQGEFMPEADEAHAQAFERPADRAAVDLHRVLHGMQNVPAQRVWDAVSADTELLQVGGREVAIPNEVVRALHLVLHITPRNGPGSKAWSDLLRGLCTIELGTWERAVALARALGIEQELGHRLALVPQAADLAASLQLPSDETGLYAALRVGERDTYPTGVISVLKLSAQQGTRERLAYARAKLFPSAELLRDRYTLARRGDVGLAVVRAWRFGRCVVGLPAAVWGWRRERLSPARR